MPTVTLTQFVLAQTPEGHTYGIPLYRAEVHELFQAQLVVIKLL